MGIDEKDFSDKEGRTIPEMLPYFTRVKIQKNQFQSVS